VARLYQIQEAVRLRVEEIRSGQPDWPCRNGCDDCCRSLAAVPRITQEEWRLIARALEGLPAQAAEMVRRRIQDSAHASRPVVCPLLDTSSGSCLVYEARPVACRAYGFYVERFGVLGCSRIEAIDRRSPEVVWGNHAALEERLRSLGPAAELSEWLASKDTWQPRSLKRAKRSRGTSGSSLTRGSEHQLEC
jgi:Fe-S-cluster containining protein